MASESPPDQLNLAPPWRRGRSTIKRVRSIPSVEAESTLKAGSASPLHRAIMQKSRQSIGYSHAGNSQEPDPSSPVSVPEISTSSLYELQTINSGDVRTIESESVEKQASFSSSAIPKPVRKPLKVRNSAKITAAAMRQKKVSGRCWNRIWRC